MQTIKWYAKPLALLIILCMVLGIAPTVSIELPSLTMTAYAATPAITFTDSNFKAALIAAGVDTGSDGEISDAEAAVITSLNVSGQNITSLDGIEYFTSLTDLNCNNNQLTALDISNNTALIDFWCDINQLTVLDVSNNTALELLSCNQNQLIALDVSNNTALTEINCWSNKLTALDISNNVALEYLFCNINQLTTLNVSNNTALTSFDCAQNRLTALDVSNNTLLEELYCYDNRLTSLDVSNNTALKSLSCGKNQLATLNVSNNLVLHSLVCNYNNMTSETSIIGLNKSITTTFYFYPQNGGGNNNNSNRSSSGGGGAGAGASTVISTYWIDATEAKAMMKTAKDKKFDYARSRRSTITGIRKNALSAFSGLDYQHDTVIGNAVQVRLHVDEPEKATKDILVSGYVKGDAVERIKTKFTKAFQNKLAFISMDQQNDFEIKVRMAAKLDLGNMNTDNLYFYSYDQKTNTYRRIANPAYRIDKNGYLYFSTKFAGDIVISDGALIKR